MRVQTIKMTSDVTRTLSQWEQQPILLDMYFFHVIVKNKFQDSQQFSMVYMYTLIEDKMTL